MANEKISDLIELTTIEDVDVLVVVDDSALPKTTKKITAQNLVKNDSDVAANTAHRSSTSNPHTVTKTQVGLSNVPDVDATARSSHTGTQLKSSISDFEHSVVSHSDTTATGAELNTLTDGSNADALHSHSGGVGPTAHASTTGQTPDDHHNQVHDFAGADHNAATLAQLNSKISDATLDDASASRPPSSHTIASHSDTTATGAELETLTDGSNADALHVHTIPVDSLPAAVAGVITLADNTTYTLLGTTNIGTDRIVTAINSALRGHDPQKDIVVYTGTGNMITSDNNNLILDKLGFSCANGTLIAATNIDYTINPSVDPFQGRNKRLAITQCNLTGGANGLGSTIGFTEGFGTVNFNGNLIVNWDEGYKISNSLSFEGLNNKSVLWNDQSSTMITLRSDNWSGQTGGVGSYIPTGFNAFNFNGNTLHPRTSGFAAVIEEGSTTALGNVSGNIFITSGVTSGGIFGPTSVGYNELQTYNIQGNQGIADNTPSIQGTIDILQTFATVIATQNVLYKLNLGNTLKTSENLLFSSRILVSDVTGFLVDEIITGGTSGFTGKIQSIDAGNNYIYVKYIVDGSSVPQYFTIGETITSSSASTTYNGVDGSFKYYGAKDIVIRLIGSMTMEKAQNGRDIYQVVPVKNAVALNELSTVSYLDEGRPMDIIVQGLIPFVHDDILEIYVKNTESTDNATLQTMVLNISGR